MFTYIDIIGLGGTGTALINPLLKLLSYHPKIDKNKLFITLCDADEINDTSNIERQNYYPNQVGNNKANETVDTLRDKYPLALLPKSVYVDLKLYQSLLERRNIRNPKDLTLTIPCVDNNATRNHIITAINNVGENVIYISPGNDYHNGQVISFAKLNGQLVGEYPLDIFPDLNKYTDRIPKATGCQEEVVSTPQLLTTNLTAATLTLSNIQNILDNNFFYQYIWFDIYKCQTQSENKVLLP